MQLVLVTTGWRYYHINMAKKLSDIFLSSHVESRGEPVPLKLFFILWEINVKILKDTPRSFTCLIGWF